MENKVREIKLNRYYLVVFQNFENDMTEIMYSFNMKTLKKVFVPFIHKNIDANCIAVRICICNTLKGVVKI